jgi:hypothetical protein
MALRRANWPDVDDVVALNADGEVMQHVDDGRPMTGARVLAEEMPRLMADGRRTDELGYWIARDRATGGFLGWFNITAVDALQPRVALSFRLRHRAWGEGYAVEGILHMIEMARVAHMSAVVATLTAADATSRRAMEAAGLILVRPWIGQWATPIAATGDRGVHYALDLTVEARSPDMTVRSGT